MEAFAAFRCRQLQAQRALILDPSSSSHPYILFREMETEERERTRGFLEDLHLVCTYVLVGIHAYCIELCPTLAPTYAVVRGCE